LIPDSKEVTFNVKHASPSKLLKTSKLSLKAIEFDLTLNQFDLQTCQSYV
jgi:hypothetical protein